MAGVAAGHPTQKLNFASAMQDFVTMFPHLDTNLIERVLRSNNGMVDQTIDHLLAISCDDPDVSAPFIDAVKPPSQISSVEADSRRRQPVAHRPISNVSPPRSEIFSTPEHPPPTYTSCQRNYPTLSSYLPPGDLTLTPRDIQPAFQKYGQVPVDVMGVQFRIPYTQPLPHSFLRLTRPITSYQGSRMEAQLAEDREFALFLHNEELLHQARNNSEFMRTLQQAEGASATHVDPATGYPPNLAHSSTPSPSTPVSDESSISQRLSATGKATRSKLLKIAKRLNLKRSNTLLLKKQSSVGKSTQRLLSEEEEEAEENMYLYNEEGAYLEEEEEYLEVEDEEEEIKTIPRQNTIEGYEVASRDACDVRIRSKLGKARAPDRPYRPTSVTPEPPPLSTLTKVASLDFADFTLQNSQKSSSSKMTSPNIPPDLLYDPTYSDCETEGPEYCAPEDVIRRGDPNVSNLRVDSACEPAPSDGLSVCSFSTIGTNEFDTIRTNEFGRKIHSDTLNSSYIIPIQPVSLQCDDSEGLYDNLLGISRKNSGKENENLINFD